MKYLFAVLGILGGTWCIASPAQAQNYPWCEYLGGEEGGGRNCGFVSFEQCMESARGNGGDCRINTMYTPPPGPHHGPNAMMAPHRRHATHKPPAKPDKNS